MLKASIFLSDEGYGHIVRQNAIAQELAKIDSDLKFQIITHGHLPMAKKLFTKAEFEDKYNNITWHKNENGSPNLTLIEKHYSNYIQKSKKYIEEFPALESDFVISDFVYEAFPLAQSNNIPGFGVAHFTWDWFFSKLYPPIVTSSLIKYFIKQAELAAKLYFPPFTPEEILVHFKKKVVQVPLIIRESPFSEKKIKDKRFKILIIDSGASVLKKSISKASMQFPLLDDVLFLAMHSKVESTNITIIAQGELLADYIPQVDLVIGRAGFNTISECIAYRTPMLLLGEASNPEMSENIINLKKSGLGSFMSLEDFETNLVKFIPAFIKNEYKHLKVSMMNHEFELNGAEIIAKDILNSI